MDSDIEIARSIQPRPIGQIADQLGVAREHLLPLVVRWPRLIAEYWKQKVKKVAT